MEACRDEEHARLWMVLDAVGRSALVSAPPKPEVVIGTGTLASRKPNACPRDVGLKGGLQMQME